MYIYIYICIIVILGLPNYLNVFVFGRRVFASRQPRESDERKYGDEESKLSADTVYLIIIVFRCSRTSVNRD